MAKRVVKRGVKPGSKRGPYKARTKTPPAPPTGPGVTVNGDTPPDPPPTGDSTTNVVVGSIEDFNSLHSQFGDALDEDIKHGIQPGAGKKGDEDDEDDDTELPTMPPDNPPVTPTPPKPTMPKLIDGSALILIMNNVLPLIALVILKVIYGKKREVDISYFKLDPEEKAMLQKAADYAVEEILGNANGLTQFIILAVAIYAGKISAFVLNPPPDPVPLTT